MSLRARLIAGLVMLVLALGLAGVLIAGHQREVLVDGLDQRLDLAAENAPRLAGLAGRAGRGQPGIGDLYVAVVADGALTPLVLPNGENPVAPDTAAVVAAVPNRHVTVGAESDPSTPVRVLVVTGEGSTLVFGLSSEPTEQALRDLRRTLAVGGLAIGIVLALLTFWIERLGLRPFRQMTETADAIVEGKTDRRAPELAPTTEAGKLGRALNSMIDTNQDSEAKLRRFVADASHELRTPLTTLRGYVRLHEQGGLRTDGELIDAMGRISREAHRMGLLVDDLLLLAQLDEGRPSDHQLVDLAPILRDLASDVNVLQPTRPVTIDITGDLTVLGDESRLAQAIGNLVTNACRHTAADRALSLRGRSENDTVRIEITDCGDGIPADHLAHLFDRFYRADPGRSRDRGGSGLGLAIVAAIIDSHRGTTGVQSTPGHGSTFWIELPSSAHREQHTR